MAKEAVTDSIERLWKKMENDYSLFNKSFAEDDKEAKKGAM